jgi:dimethylglycine dehydrogenase
MTNTMPKTGRIVLTPMLNEFGKLIGDFTIAKGRRRALHDLGLVSGAGLSHALVRAAPAG